MIIGKNSSGFKYLLIFLSDRYFKREREWPQKNLVVCSRLHMLNKELHKLWIWISWNHIKNEDKIFVENTKICFFVHAVYYLNYVWTFLDEVEIKCQI